LYTFDFSEFVFCFFGGDGMDCKAALDVVYETEVLGCFVDCDYVLVACWVIGVCSDFSIDFDESLLQDRCDFSFIQSVLETVSSLANITEMYLRKRINGRDSRPL
jgi:hypothetical protein